MPITCPVCSAANDAGPACRRCRADLALCFAVESQRDRAVAGARAAAVDGRVKDAIDFAEAAAELRHGTDASQLLAVLHLLVRNFAVAWTCYRASVDS